LAGCQSPRTPSNIENVRRSAPLLGTFVVVSASGPDRATVHDAISVAFAEIQRIDGLMSLHHADSELSRVNAHAAERPVAVSADLFRVVGKAMEIARESDGSFDPTIRPLADLWGFIWKEYRLPSASDLAAVLPNVNYRAIELDAGRRTIRFTQPGISLDLGGLAKGYAVDCALDALRAHGITNALVRAGGDLRVMGAPPGRAHWLVQLEDPRKAGRRTTIPLRDAAVSTSGDYENFFTVAGRRYSHILHPRTGWPVEGLAACSVIAPTCLESDAWATACFVYGVEKSLAKFGSRLALRFTLAPASDHDLAPVRQSAHFPAAGLEPGD
jgi:thiamine biosynthesis lipoprotein